MQLDYIIQGLIFSKISNLEFDIIHLIAIFVIFLIFTNNATHDYVYDKINYFLEDKSYVSINFKQNDKNKKTIKFKALMHFISTYPNESVKKLAECVEFGWNRYDEEDVEKFSGYRISQENFKFDSDVEGKFWISDESYKTDENRNHNRKCWNLEVKSKKLDMHQLIDWVNKKQEQYNEYIKRMTFEKQIILDITYDSKDNDIVSDHELWESNVTFENRFFENKDKILKKIDFFLNNKEWYIRKGIPYVLGFLLYGKPGCGKTSFIKALMNYTGRHGINIRLTDDFDMDSLKDVIQKEKIDDYVLPNDKRILIFEDIDCMGDMVKKRKDVDKETDTNEKDSDDEMFDKISEKQKLDLKKMIAENKKSNTKNNLSYFLNILDGLIECNGRIIIMTTNKPDNLDPALIRPGRIDEKIEFKEVSSDIFVKIFCNFYEIDKSVIDCSKLEKIDSKYTPAEIINICRGYENYEEALEFILN